MDCLHDLVTVNDLEALKSRLADGYNPNEPIGSAQVTPLHVAAQFNRIEAAQILLNAGADIHAISYPLAYTPLGLALNFKHDEMIYLLRQALAHAKFKHIRAA